MTNDTAVYDAMRYDNGELIWAERVGRPDAIVRDGLTIGGELRYCPHEWLDDRGYVSLELSQKHPYQHDAR
jgi:hypothetical protein